MTGDGALATLRPMGMKANNLLYFGDNLKVLREHGTDDNRLDIEPKQTDTASFLPGGRRRRQSMERTASDGNSQTTRRED